LHKHPYFDLYLHDDQELAVHTGGAIVEREMLHEWPLSCVERIATTHKQWIYKTQSGPTVEAAFYAVAQSDLLAPTRVLYQQDGYTCMLGEFVDAPLIEDLGLNEGQALSITRQVRARMDEMEGHLPYLYDIRTPELWQSLVDGTLENILNLIGQGRYTQTTPDIVEELRGWAHSEQTLQAVRRKPGYVHGDFTGDNLFVLGEGDYRVIDWQRPYYGPTELDIASMLESLEFDPLQIVGPGIVQIGSFMLIRWFTVCAVRWFPDGAETYDGLTAEHAAKIRSLM
jgi:hypothetical protein